MKLSFIYICLLFSLLGFGQEKKIIVGGDYNYPPYSFINEKGEEVGYDVDVIKAIMKEVGMEVEFKFDNWNITLNRLKNDEIDVIASIVYSESREKQYDFTFPLHTEYYAIFAKKRTKINEVFDLESKRPAYLKGDISNEIFLRPMGLLSDSVPVTSLPEAFELIRSGKCDYVIAPYPLGMKIIKEQGFRNIKAKKPQIIPSVYCLAVNEGNSKLLAKLNIGIERLSRSGELEMIYNKWVKYQRKEDQYRSWFIYTIYILIGLTFITLILILFWYSLRKQVQIKTKQIKDAEEVYQKVFNSVDDALLIVSNKGIVTDANIKALEIYDLDYDSIINSSFLEIVSDDNRDLVGNLIKSMGSEFVPFKGEVKKEIKGKTIYFTSKGLRISLDDEDRYLTVMHDITDEKLSFRKLNEAKRIAEEANNAKSTFLSTISHEVRTPLNAIIGYSNLLNNTPLTSKQNDFNEKIGTSTEILLNLVNDILDLTKIEANKLSLDVEPINLKAIIEKICNVIKIKVMEKGLDFRIDISDEIPEWVEGNELRLSQILLNILNNATKYTDSGYVSLKVHKKSVEGNRESNREHVLFSIKDSGIGITDEMQDRLFEPFEQAQNTNNRKYGGTGLGLAITKQLVGLMGGKIIMESKVGIGSVFNISLSFNKVSVDFKANKLNQHSQYDYGIILKDRSVLLVEDNLFNAEIISEQLKELGFHVQHAESGARAIIRLQNSLFDVILMDIDMPDMNGYETAQYIVSESLSRAPIIALSAHALESERTKAKDVGMVAYLYKPVKIEELVDTIMKHMGRNSIKSTAHSKRVKKGLVYFGGNMDLYQRGEKRFKSNFQHVHEKLIPLYEQKSNELISHVHNLKSALKMLGDDFLSDKAARFEKELMVDFTSISKEQIQEFSALLKYLIDTISTD